MTCLNPVLAYKKTNGQFNFMRKSDYDAPHAHKALLPCRKCLPCRKKEAMNWSTRMIHESKMHKISIFLTLTYDDEFLPEHNNLTIEHMQKFMKRLRKHLSTRKDELRNPLPIIKIRYLYVGEYGDTSGRAHYHACVFGYVPDDLILHSKKPQYNIYKSETLTNLWGKGFVSIGYFNSATANYCSKYILKTLVGKDALKQFQITDSDTGELIQKQPPFKIMSRNPGLGSTFFEKYESDLINHDKAVIDGKELPVPDYYIRKLKKTDIQQYENIKRDRHNQAVEFAQRNPHLDTLYGLEAVEAVLLSKQNLYKKGSI